MNTIKYPDRMIIDTSIRSPEKIYDDVVVGWLNLYQTIKISRSKAFLDKVQEII